MKGLDPAHAGVACDPPGGGGCQVRAFDRQSGIRRRKGSLDEQNVGISSKTDYGIAIGRRIGRIGDIRDLLAGVMVTASRNRPSGSSISSVPGFVPIRIG